MRVQRSVLGICCWIQGMRELISATSSVLLASYCLSQRWKFRSTYRPSTYVHAWLHFPLFLIEQRTHNFKYTHCHNSISCSSNAANTLLPINLNLNLVLPIVYIYSNDLKHFRYSQFQAQLNTHKFMHNHQPQFHAVIQSYKTMPFAFLRIPLIPSQLQQLQLISREHYTSISLPTFPSILLSTEHHYPHFQAESLSIILGT